MLGAVEAGTKTESRTNPVALFNQEYEAGIRGLIAQARSQLDRIAAASQQSEAGSNKKLTRAERQALKVDEEEWKHRLTCRQSELSKFEEIKSYGVMYPDPEERMREYAKAHPEFAKAL
ncbi:hypothetical protein I316_00438 [Kwoniella heveanensis BCC8398]|uniref:Uncharacterized protein n=1 Tax=Kwoniella heveanensis BCC8398 TaxID=1296120 RepID=A0A1B9H4L3_9TREE|nr:hypothetical protein I316_00438 [Kwoniella heveanensis BCC8398]